MIITNKKYREIKRYRDLTEAQKDQIWNGSACGDPSNKPTSEDDANKRQWIVLDGIVIGWGYGLKYTDYKICNGCHKVIDEDQFSTKKYQGKIYHYSCCFDIDRHIKMSINIQKNIMEYQKHCPYYKGKIKGLGSCSKYEDDGIDKKCTPKMADDCQSESNKAMYEIMHDL